MAICITRDTGSSARADGKWLHALAALAFFCASTANVPLLAQGIESEEAIDAIVGSEVKTEETRAKSDSERIVAAIGNTRENAEKVRKTFNLDELDIVFVPDIGEEEESSIDEAMTQNQVDIQTLHEAIEGSALFYHAVDSRSIMVRDIIAMEYGNDRVTIFVSGSPPQ